MDPDEALEFGHKRLTSVYNKHAPFMTSALKYARRLSKETEEAMHQSGNLRKAKKHEGLKQKRTHTKRNKVTSLLRVSQENTFKI